MGEKEIMHIRDSVVNPLIIYGRKCIDHKEIYM
jgi:hypothetical protein